MTLDHLTMMDDADPAHDGDEESGFGCLQTARGGLPLQRLAVDGRITGLLYRLTVTQTFVNVHAEPLEATYIFPLPARAHTKICRCYASVGRPRRSRFAARSSRLQTSGQAHRSVPSLPPRRSF